MSKLLSPERSLCKKRQKIIVSEENRMKHIANNPNACNVRQYKIDGDVITGTETKRCDYLVLNDDKKVAYFIELKRPCRINEAIDQIQATIEKLKPELPGYICHGRIVCNAVHRVPPSKTIDRIMKYKVKHKGTIEYESRKLEEGI